MTPYQFIQQHAKHEDIIFCKDDSRWYYSRGPVFNFVLRNLETGISLWAESEIDLLPIDCIKRIGFEQLKSDSYYLLLPVKLIAVYSSDPSPKKKLELKIKDMKRAVLEAEEEYRKL